jgi:hypothetical protein
MKVPTLRRVFYPSPHSLTPYTDFNMRFPTDTHYNTFHVPNTHSTVNGAPETNAPTTTKRNLQWTAIHSTAAAAHGTLQHTARTI